MRHGLAALWKENRTFLLFIVLMSMFRSVVADWNTVPTGSMKPTILEGDRILVNKMAYDLRLPFTRISLLRLDDPQRGDIVVFESEAAAKRLVKRVVGLPGDLVAMDHNRLWINGEAISYSVADNKTGAHYMTEHLDPVEYQVRWLDNRTRLSSFSPIKVPEHHYLVLGDNRDNSADSRVIGFVPREEIVGRARHLVLSLDYDNYYLPRSERFFKRL